MSYVIKELFESSGFTEPKYLTDEKWQKWLQHKLYKKRL